MLKIKLIEDRPNGHEVDLIVSKKGLKQLNELVTAGGFRRFKIDIYSETRVKPSVKHLERLYEFFDKIYLFKNKKSRLKYFSDPANQIINVPMGESKEKLIARAKELLPQVRESIFTYALKKYPERIEEYLKNISEQIRDTGEQQVIDNIGVELTQIVKRLFPDP